MIHVSPQQIADARENVVKFPTHVEYIAWRFEKEHGVKVIDHKLLCTQIAKDDKHFVISGDVGVALSRRLSG